MTGLIVPELIRCLEDTITRNGGTAFLVGGGSIDMLSGKEPKDWDIEVFGVSYNQLVQIAQTVGEADLVGSKFGIVKLKGYPIDVELSIPRVENKNGPKHQDFDITLVPDLSIREAARRRDFTINTIYIDLRTSKVIDEWGGLKDLHDGILRHVDPKTFVEDPLRAFRAIQLLARKVPLIHIDLLNLIDSMHDSVKELTGSAILGELTKALMLSDEPSNGLCQLVQTRLIDLFPELKALTFCHQNPIHHPEGNVFVHTLKTVDEAARWRSEIPTDWQLAFMFGMLLHDVGKPKCLDPETLSTICHDVEGGPIARTFMERLTDNQDLISKVCSIVEGHMRPRLLLKAGARGAGWRRLQNICPLNILAYVSMCDEDGRGTSDRSKMGKDDPTFKKTMFIFEELGKPSATIPPVLMGRHLIEAGYKPGVQFGAMLKKAYEYQMETGCTDIKKLLEIAAE